MSNVVSNVVCYASKAIGSRVTHRKPSAVTGPCQPSCTRRRGLPAPECGASRHPVMITMASLVIVRILIVPVSHTRPWGVACVTCRPDASAVQLSRSLLSDTDRLSPIRCRVLRRRIRATRPEPACRCILLSGGQSRMFGNGHRIVRRCHSPQERIPRSRTQAVAVAGARGVVSRSGPLSRNRRVVGVALNPRGLSGSQEPTEHRSVNGSPFCLGVCNYQRSTRLCVTNWLHRSTCPDVCQPNALDGGHLVDRCQHGSDPATVVTADAAD